MVHVVDIAIPAAAAAAGPRRRLRDVLWVDALDLRVFDQNLWWVDRFGTPHRRNVPAFLLAFAKQYLGTDDDPLELSHAALSVGLLHAPVSPARRTRGNRAAGPL
jgi:hypothetical protein